MPNFKNYSEFLRENQEYVDMDNYEPADENILDFFETLHDKNVKIEDIKLLTLRNSGGNVGLYRIIFDMLKEGIFKKSDYNVEDALGARSVVYSSRYKFYEKPFLLATKHQMISDNRPSSSRFYMLEKDLKKIMEDNLTELTISKF